ncbi:MAG TPA: short-chain dehydrogenase [Chloroflexi bacterium]|nr:short-chain dehydrogenase [Chloroflexota bacterium]
MDLGISDKVAIVSAGSEGLGRATALRLAREGARVVICSRHEEKLYAAAEAITAATGASVLAVPADVTRPEDIERVVQRSVEEVGPPAILVNNTGGPPSGQVLSFSDEQWQSAFDLVFFSALRFTRLVIPYMRTAEWGRIVNITSVTVKQPIDTLVLSNAARAAVVAFMKTLAGDVAKDGITVNSVGPAPTATNRMIELIEAGAKQRGISLEESRAAWTAAIPMGRIGQPGELADVVAFLCSENAGFITGVFIPVDGGQTRAVV